MLCSNCGTNNSDDAHFCTTCGIDLTQSNARPQATGVPQPESQGANYAGNGTYNQQQSQNAYGPYNGTYSQQPGQPAYNMNGNPYQQGYNQPPYAQQFLPNAKSAYLAGLLAILLGALGIHNFYLGNVGKGVAQLLLTVLGGWIFGLGAIAAAVWSLIEGIMLFTGGISVDGKGVPLNKSF